MPAPSTSPVSRLAALLLLAVLIHSAPAQTSTRSADGFDFPVAPPNAAGFYKSRGFRAGGHLGEDWVTDGGSAKGFGLPVYAIGNGVVVLARDIHVGWGNVVVIRHAWIEDRQLRFADSLYAHLDKIRVREKQQVKKGQQIGNIGNNHGMYPPHLHFEIHKDLSIGVNHAQGTRDLRSYWVPTDFITDHRLLHGGGHNVPIPAPAFLLPTPENPWSIPHYFWLHRFHPQHPHAHHGNYRHDSESSEPSGSHPRHHSGHHHKKKHSPETET